METIIIWQKDHVNNVHNIINCTKPIWILKFIKFILKQILNNGYIELKYL